MNMRNVTSNMGEEKEEVEQMRGGEEGRERVREART